MLPLAVPPYSRLARAYDGFMGRRFFDGLREAFERLVARFRIGFSSAADLGCGTGLFARYLNATRGVPVFAVDRSPAMLRVAAGNCRGARVTLLRQDIRALRLPRPVDLVTANFDTVNHLLGDGELPALFARVHAQLQPGGHFVFDFLTSCGPRFRTAVCRRSTRDGRRRVVQQIRWLPRLRMLVYRVVFQAAGAPTRVERHRERTYAPHDVARWLMEAGFVLRAVLDAATLGPAQGCPARVLVVAVKGATPRRGPG